MVKITYIFESAFMNILLINLIDFGGFCLMKDEKRDLKDIITSLIEKILDMRQKIALLILAFGIFSVLSYICTYSFLYGYYFGGEVENSISNLNLFVNFVPFQFNTLSFTWLLISLSVSLILFLFKVVGDKGLSNILLASLGIFIFHIMLTYYFSDIITPNTVMAFSAIWILPIFIAILTLFTMLGIKSTLKTYAGALTGTNILILLIACEFFIGLREELSIVLFYMFFFITGIAFYFIPYGNKRNFIFISPYLSFFLLIIIIVITPLSEWFKGIGDTFKIIVIILPAVLLSFLLNKKFKKAIDKEPTNTEGESKNGIVSEFIYHVIGGVTNHKTNKRTIMFLVLMILLTYVMVPRVSYATAKLIRMFNPDIEQVQKEITIKDIDDKIVTIKGTIIVEENEVLFISNDEWELEQIKVESYKYK